MILAIPNLKWISVLLILIILRCICWEILLDSENCKEAATARDRFVLQPSILQRLGWKLLRLWVLDWLDDPELVKQKNPGIA